MHDPRHAGEGRFIQSVLDQNRLERAPPVDMAELHPLDVERHGVLLPRDASDVFWIDIEELGLLVEKPPDQPEAGDPAYRRILPRHKPHRSTSSAAPRAFSARVLLQMLRDVPRPELDHVTAWIGHVGGAAPSVAVGGMIVIEHFEAGRAQSLDRRLIS